MSATMREATASQQLGEQLRRQRLEHRAGRLERVLLALHDRVAAREAAGLVPPPLLAAIEGFEHELRHVRDELRGLR
jgi:hypothetical protein